MFKDAECEFYKSNNITSTNTHQCESEKLELAEAYIPLQQLNKIYTPIEALSKGTIFPELYKPYKYQ